MSKSDMVDLAIPDDVEVLAAVGRVALRHGQLDRVLRMTVKSILAVSAPKALNDTFRQGSQKLRERVKKLAKQKIGEGPAYCRLEALLEKAWQLTDHRNKYLHNLWARDSAGNFVIINEYHDKRPIPTAPELNALAIDIGAVAGELNYARLEGFLADALAAKAVKKSDDSDPPNAP